MPIERSGEGAITGITRTRARRMGYPLVRDTRQRIAERQQKIEHGINGDLFISVTRPEIGRFGDSGLVWLSGLPNNSGKGIDPTNREVTR